MAIPREPILLVLNMLAHHTKNKGDFAVLKALVSISEHGLLPLLPISEHAPFDIVAYGAGKFYRIQVKFKKLSKRGTLDISFRKNWSDSKGTYSKPIEKSDIDLFIVYNPETDLCYFLNPLLYNKSISIRVEKTKNNQEKGVLAAKDFLNWTP